MIYPSIADLTKNEFNRYELVIGTAKSARLVTDEYVKEREAAEKMISNRETEKPLSALISPEYRDQKSVRLAITKIASGEYTLVEREGEVVDIDAEAAKRLAAELAVINKQRERESADEDDFNDHNDAESLDDDVEDLDEDVE